MAILFLCTANSCRSQMAEGLYRSLAPGAEVHSAGTRPGRVHPLAIRVMEEIGIDISGHVSKGTGAIPTPEIDTVVTVCDDAAACPSPTPGARSIHWSIDDPDRATGSEEHVLAAFRRARDDLRRRIEALLAGAPLEPPPGRG